MPFPLLARVWYSEISFIVPISSCMGMLFKEDNSFHLSWPTFWSAFQANISQHIICTSTVFRNFFHCSSQFMYGNAFQGGQELSPFLADVLICFSSKHIPAHSGLRPKQHGVTQTLLFSPGCLPCLNSCVLFQNKQLWSVFYHCFCGFFVPNVSLLNNQNYQMSLE